MSFRVLTCPAPRTFGDKLCRVKRGPVNDLWHTDPDPFAFGIRVVLAVFPVSYPDASIDFIVDNVGNSRILPNTIATRLAYVACLIVPGWNAHAGQFVGYGVEA